ncbi:MAG: Transcriptional regulator, LuxR family protein [uncultured bacterium]|nr:MAG: Transcriptional regulator, LuxR family protein [uncultured bacterium]KAF0173083.1 MAG: Transcriptional regulator LuxR family protein [Paracoccaceae bacterium]
MPRFASMATRMHLLSAIQLTCGIVLIFDIGGEIHEEWLRDRPFAGMTRLHLIVESLATALLFIGFALTMSHIRVLRHAEAAKSQLLGSLRGQFDVILHDHFIRWGLSKAETDIALLSLRGLKIAEIAAARHTREGTIKSQLSTIFKKSGVSTRTEFLALFMEEFLDHGANHPIPTTDSG